MATLPYNQSSAKVDTECEDLPGVLMPPHHISMYFEHDLVRVFLEIQDVPIARIEVPIWLGPEVPALKQVHKPDSVFPLADPRFAIVLHQDN